MLVNKQFLPVEELAQKLWTIAEASYQFGAPWKESDFISDLASGQSEYLIVIEENKILGFLGYHWILDEAEITNIAVCCEAKGQGIGDLLLTSLMDQVGSRGVEHVFLEVRNSNEAAQKLYRKNKFVPVGKRKHYYHNPEEDGIVMSGKVRIDKCLKQKI